MHYSHSNSRHVVQSDPVPTAHYDGPCRNELQAAKVKGRFRFSRETAAQVAALIYAVPEKMERRGW